MTTETRLVLDASKVTAKCARCGTAGSCRIARTFESNRGTVRAIDRVSVECGKCGRGYSVSFVPESMKWVLIDWHTPGFGYATRKYVAPAKLCVEYPLDALPAARTY